MKCGTTSLHHYLSLHPKIGMSETKELAFFAKEHAWARGLDWYRAQFDPTFAIRGESSPHYTSFPKFQGVPEKMHGVIPDAKLIYIVRDPIDRLISHYRHKVASGIETRPLADTIAVADSDYIVRSQYHRQLELYLRVYDRNQIQIIDHKDLRDQRRETLREVFTFLGADPDVWDVRFHRELHRTQRKRIKTPLGERIAKTWPMRRVARLPEDIRWVIEDLIYWPLSRPVVEPDLPPPLRAEITRQLAEDIARWRVFTGQPYDHWSI